MATSGARNAAKARPGAIDLHSFQTNVNQRHSLIRSIEQPQGRRGCWLARKQQGRAKMHGGARLLLRRTANGGSSGSLSSLLALPAAVVLGLAATEEGHPPSIDERRGRVWPVGGGAALMAAAAAAPAAAGEKQQKRVTAASLAGRSNQQSPHPCSQKGHFVKGCDELKIFSGRGHPTLAEEVGAILGVKPGKAIVSSFADGETQVQVQESVRGLDVYIFQSCNAPVNDRIMELLLLTSTMHRASAKRVTAVIPFMGYKHHRRVAAVSSTKTAKYLYSHDQDVAKMMEVLGVDRVIGVDLQRPGHTSEGPSFNVPIESCITDSLGIAFFAQQLGEYSPSSRVTVVAPNPDTVAKAQIFRHGLMDAWLPAPSEGDSAQPQQQCVTFAMFSRAPVVDGSKLHHEAELLGSVQGADVIIVDDIIDTANTLVRAAQVCKESGAKNVFIWASHGLFTRDALRKIEECPEITKVACTNTLPLPEWYSGKKVVQVSVAPLIAKRIEAAHYRRHAINEKETFVPDPEGTP